MVIFTYKKKAVLTDTQIKRNGLIYINLDENIGIASLKEKDEQRQKNWKNKILVIPVKYYTKEVWIDSPYAKSRFKLCNQDQNYTLT